MFNPFVLEFKKKNTYYLNRLEIRNIKNVVFLLIKIVLNIVGKIFKWILKKNKIHFFLGYSHKNIFFFQKKINFISLSKTSVKYIFTNLNIQILKKKILFFRKYNIFTLRGLLVKSNAYFKKQGKISTYIIC